MYVLLVGRLGRVVTKYVLDAGNVILAGLEFSKYILDIITQF